MRAGGEGRRTKVRSEHAREGGGKKQRQGQHFSLDRVYRYLPIAHLSNIARQLSAIRARLSREWLPSSGEGTR